MPIYGAMAVQRASYCTVRNQQNPVASIKHLLYNHTHSDWMKLDKIDFTLLKKEGVGDVSRSDSKKELQIWRQDI